MNKGDARFVRLTEDYNVIVQLWWALRLLDIIDGDFSHYIKGHVDNDPWGLRLRVDRPSTRARKR